MYPYTFQSYNNQNQNQNTRPEIIEVEEAIGPTVEEDTKVLTMLDEALLNKEEGYQYYRRLQNMFDDTRDKETIRRISLDKMKHKKIVEDLYKDISGNDAPDLKADEVKISRNLLVELAKSITNEYDDVEFYRRLMFMMENPRYRDMLFEILNDDQIHAGKLNYLYSKHK